MHLIHCILDGGGLICHSVGIWTRVWTLRIAGIGHSIYRQYEQRVHRSNFMRQRGRWEGRGVLRIPG